MDTTNATQMNETEMEELYIDMERDRQQMERLHRFARAVLSGIEGETNERGA